ncbi:hypothetical protein AB6A40_006427 [Gnathostoma spinigerum]|uniref:E3 ubiquitin-protein ligase n=1 Tax=Gnathostoma spinigerum TaxID=75299 RepID=A0ABD6EIC5_9BILA
MSISSASFLDLHRYLTGNEDFDFAYLPTESLRSFVRVVSRWIPYRHFSRVLSTEPLIWQPFCFLSLPESYDDLFQHYFGQVCVNCATVPRTPLICLLCSSLVCLDSCCVNSGGYLPDNEVERHAVQCGSGCGCFISLNTSLVVFVSQQRAALWGSVYLDAHGEEDRNLKRGKPLFLSSRRVSRLRSDWTLQVFEHLSLNFFHFEHLSAFLRDAHYVLSN